MAVVVHMAAISNISPRDSGVNDLLSLSNFAWRRHLSFVSGLEVWSHVVEVVLLGLLIHFDKSVVKLNILVSRILRFEWMVLLVGVNSPHLLAIIYRRVFGNFLNNFRLSWICVSLLVHLNYLLVVRSGIYLVFLRGDLNFIYFVDVIVFLSRESNRLLCSDYFGLLFEATSGLLDQVLLFFKIFDLLVFLSNCCLRSGIVFLWCVF